MCGVVMLVCVCVLQPRGLPAWTSRAPPIVGPRSRVFNVELHGQLASHTQAPVWLGPRCLSSLAAQVRGSDYETRVRLGQCHSDRSSHVFLKVIRSEAFVERPLTALPHETLRFFAVHSGRLEDKWYESSVLFVFGVFSDRQWVGAFSVGVVLGCPDMVGRRYLGFCLCFLLGHVRSGVDVPNALPCVLLVLLGFFRLHRVQLLFHVGGWVLPRETTFTLAYKLSNFKHLQKE